MKYPDDIREGVLGLVRSGVPAAVAARRYGVEDSTAQKWCGDAGIALRRGRPGRCATMSGRKALERGPRPSPRSRLTLADRAAIQEGLRAGRSMRSIAAELGFSHSTVSREVARASGRSGYGFVDAQLRAERLARRGRPRRVDSDPALRSYVLSGLARGWSPEQVSARMRSDFPDNGSMRISHEAIYQALYVQGRGALRHELECELALRSGRCSRKPRSKLPRRPGRGWAEGCEIALRPAGADSRAVPGHWEGDLVVGGDGRSCLVTLVERSTRYLEMRRLPTHESATVVDLLRGMVAAVPGDVRSSLLSTLTWDQGVEMAAHAEFTAATDIRVYFCDPHSPWQRGTNENTNGLIRQYFPKGTEFADVTDEEVARVQALLNGRPRKTLGWSTPAEALARFLAESRDAGAVQ